MNTTGQETAIDIKGKIKNFIITNFLFGNESDFIGEDESFLESEIIDSTGILEIITFIEENYNIKIEDDELVPKNLDSLNNATAFIQKKTGNGS